MVVLTFLLVDGIARQVGKQAISLYVKMNGVHFAIKRVINALIALIVGSRHLLIRMSIVIWKERMRMVGM